MADYLDLDDDEFLALIKSDNPQEAREAVRNLEDRRACGLDAGTDVTIKACTALRLRVAETSDQADAENYLIALLSMCSCDLEVSGYKTSHVHLVEARRLHSDFGIKELTAELLLRRAWLTRSQGAFDEARILAKGAAALAYARGDFLLEAQARIVVGFICLDIATSEGTSAEDREKIIAEAERQFRISLKLLPATGRATSSANFGIARCKLLTGKRVEADYWLTLAGRALDYRMTNSGARITWLRGLNLFESKLYFEAVGAFLSVRSLVGPSPVDQGFLALDTAKTYFALGNFWAGCEEINRASTEFARSKGHFARAARKELKKLATSTLTVAAVDAVRKRLAMRARQSRARKFNV